MLLDQRTIKILLFFVVFFVKQGFSQQMEYSPMLTNPSIQKDRLKEGVVNIDSTFIFTADTLQLPIFDDFSSNKFQEYFPDFNDPSVTSSVFYKLKNPITQLPLESSVSFNSQQTFKRIFNMETGEFVDSSFSSTPVSVADFSVFPVQYDQQLLYPPYYLFDTINDVSTNPIDTVWLTNPPYIQDSVRVFFQAISDPGKYWADAYAYLNNRFAVNPRSLGVVTFDGLDENGNPYQYGSISPNYADKLTSKNINLSSLTPGDSIYLSFLFQPQGLGDEPENGDSLVLEFYQNANANWQRVWSTAGESNRPFQAVTVAVKDPVYLSDGFKFRFRNYGSLAGALDHFHLDYIHLRSLSFQTDTLFKDFAFSYPLLSLIDTYTSVPWDHYQNTTDNKMTDSLEVYVHNGSPLPENYQNGQVNIFYNSALEGNYVLNGFTLAQGNINFQPRTTHQSIHDLTLGYEFDKTKPGNQQVFEVKSSASAQFPNFGANDSTLLYQSFYNYYSYDDGTAEAAFGPTGAQSRLAIGYEAYEEDSILGVSICFVPSVNDVSDKLFLLTVWDDINGNPGSVLYEDDVFFPRAPISGYGENYFHSYYLVDTMKLAVPKRFYVGWRQIDPQRLNAGLDRNTNHSNEIFYSVDGENSWLTSPFQGSAMIRPIFSTRLNGVLGIPDKQAFEQIIIFPNPASNYLTIRGEFAENIESSVMDIFGTIVKKTNGTHISIEDISSGTYFLSSPSFKGKVFKFIKQ
ncbi:MAG: hypothetical protein RL037_55 [Bacteroidota bacterium]|jgi:hypothetical protein